MSIHSEKLRFAGMSLLCAAMSGLLASVFSRIADALCSNALCHPLVAFLMPLSGLASYGLYRACRVSFSYSTAEVLSDIAEERRLPYSLAPLVFSCACLCFACGGTVGKEAVALQMGAAMSFGVAMSSGMDGHFGRACARCGMASAFAALLGCPVAAAVFAYESTRKKLRDPLCAACVLGSGFVGHWMSCAMGCLHVAGLWEGPLLTSDAGGMLPALFAGASAVAACGAFAWGLEKGRAALSRMGAYGPLVVGGAAFAVLSLLLGPEAVFGSGVSQMEEAFGGDVDGLTALLRFVVPLLLLSCGFKGGEIFPVLSLGCVVGAVSSSAVGGDMTFGAAIGAWCGFAAATGCPFSAISAALELFGLNVGLVALPICLLGAMFFGRYSLFNGGGKPLDVLRWDMGNTHIEHE